MSVAYAIDHLNTYPVSLKPKEHWELEFQKNEGIGIWVIQLVVKQTRSVIDDIIFYLFDYENRNIWVNFQQAIAAGATASRLPQALFEHHGKVAASAISFRPKPNKQFYLVLDNSHSVYRSKEITVNVYWIWTESPLRNYVKSQLDSLGWQSIWEYLQDADRDLADGKVPETCLNLRSALSELMIKICENNSIEISFEDGKTTPMSEIILGLKKCGISKRYANFIGRIWALNSEHVHPEKISKDPPTTSDVIYVNNLTWTTIQYLLSEHEKEIK